MDPAQKLRFPMRYHSALNGFTNALPGKGNFEQWKDAKLRALATKIAGLPIKGWDRDQTRAY